METPTPAIEEEAQYENTATSRLFKIKKTQLEMVKDRGFDISNEQALFTYRISDFKKHYTEQAEAQGITVRKALSILYRNPDGTHVYVYYPDTVQGAKFLGLDQITELTKTLEEYKGITNVIIISELPMSSHVRDKIAGLPMYHIQFFVYEDMTYNPTKHYLVPRHTLLSEVEARDFLRRNKLKFSQLPWLSIEDPITRYYGWRPGQIVKIDRENLAIETLVMAYPTYRAVVDRPLNKEPTKK